MLIVIIPHNQQHHVPLRIDYAYVPVRVNSSHGHIHDSSKLGN